MKNTRQIRTYGDVLPKLVEFITYRYSFISLSKRIIMFMDGTRKVSITFNGKCKREYDKYIESFNEWSRLNNCRPIYYIDKESVAERIRNKTRFDRKKYNEYIISDTWKKKSAICISKAGNKCEVCESTKDLNTHHYNYVFLFRETESDLFCLCSICHKKYHSVFPSSKLPQDTNLPRATRLLHIIETINKK